VTDSSDTAAPTRLDRPGSRQPPTTVWLRVTTTPDDATVLLGGPALPKSLVAELTKSLP
jgi:hypothetical protein